jgi:hypothetical protein
VPAGRRRQPGLYDALLGLLQAFLRLDGERRREDPGEDL